MDASFKELLISHTISTNNHISSARKCTGKLQTCKMKCCQFPDFLISSCMNQESRWTQTYRPVTATVVLPDRHPHRHPLTRLSVFFACSHQKSVRTKWAGKNQKNTRDLTNVATKQTAGKRRSRTERREEEERSVLRPSIMHKLRSCFNGWTTSWMKEKVWKLKIKATREETSQRKEKWNVEQRHAFISHSELLQTSWNQRVWTCSINVWDIFTPTHINAAAMLLKRRLWICLSASSSIRLNVMSDCRSLVC